MTSLPAGSDTGSGDGLTVGAVSEGGIDGARLTVRDESVWRGLDPGVAHPAISHAETSSTVADRG